MTTALYSGSFDPVTFGHIDVMRRASRLFPRLVVAIGAHHAKKALFSAEERVAMLTVIADEIAAETGNAVVVDTFEGLVVDAARAAGARVIVRGIRSVTDFDYEVQMAGMNAHLAPDIDTIYLSAAPHVSHIASSLVRQVAALGGALDAFVPSHVADMLKARVSG